MKILGVIDLTLRWDYTRQGVHQKQKNDKDFPQPIAHINNGRTQVFLENDIIKYEKKRRELTDQNYKEWNRKKWCFAG